MKNNSTAIGSTGLGLLCAMTLASSGLLFGQSWADDAINSPSNKDTSTPLVSPNTSSSTTSSSTSTSTTTSTTSLSNASGIPMYSTSTDVVVEPDTSLSIMPHIQVGQGTTTLVHVLNPSPNTVTFASPGLNINEPIPPHSQRTVQITPEMAANLTPGQEVAYSINDSNGNILASSDFVNGYPAIAFIQTNKTTAMEEQRNETTTTNKPTKKNAGRSAVRGYW